MSLGTMSVTTVKRASINNLWTLDLLCFDLVSGACAIAMMGRDGETATSSWTCGSPASAPRPPRPACPRTGPA